MEQEKIKLHPVITCKEDMKAKEIAEILKNSNERRIFVIDNGEKLCGIITTTDLVYKSLAGNSLTAKEIMTKNIKSVDKKDPLEKAIEIMNEIKSYSCPVVEKGKIIGIISYHDVVNHILNQEI